MSLFSRIAMLLKANLNDLVRRAEDPEPILEQLVLEMRQQLIEARGQVARVIAAEKRLKAQHHDELGRASLWEKRAMTAIEAGRDDLAGEALGRRNAHRDLAAELQAQWEAHKAMADKMRVALRGLQGKIEETQRRKQLLIARKSAIAARQTMAQALGALETDGALATLTRMESRLLEQEAQVEATLALHTEGDAIERDFVQLEAEVHIHDDLNELKQRMGRLEHSQVAELSFEPEPEQQAAT